jgi:FixJ family two-component response regulator
MTAEATVFVVDDDKAVRRFLEGLIASVGLGVRSCASAQEFFDACEPGSRGCILLDIRMPGTSGLEMQKMLKEKKIDLPVIILTGHGDVQIAVHAMKAGAVDFIEKPFNNELLLDRVQKTVEESLRSSASNASRGRLAERLRLLTPREHQVLDLVVAGETNKGVARQLRISERTVEIHRARVMDKMQAKSLAELVRMAAMLGG